jgi:hypothetical protein
MQYTKTGKHVLTKWPLKYYKFAVINSKFPLNIH